jgi:hypothetical protein
VPAEAVSLMSHRAGYRLPLDSARPSQDVESAAGAMLYEVVDRCEGGVVLDRTAFYPGGGGQQPDRGTLYLGDQSWSVTGFRWEDEALVHLVDGEPPPVGTIIRGEIERKNRRRSSGECAPQHADREQATKRDGHDADRCYRRLSLEQVGDEQSRHDQ